MSVVPENPRVSTNPQVTAVCRPRKDGNFLELSGEENSLAKRMLPRGRKLIYDDRQKFSPAHPSLDLWDGEATGYLLLYHWLQMCQL